MSNYFLIKRITSFIKTQKNKKSDKEGLQEKITPIEVAEVLSPKGHYSSPADIVGDFERSKAFGNKLFGIKNKPTGG